jgi:hypothetical protein
MRRKRTSSCVEASGRWVRSRRALGLGALASTLALVALPTVATGQTATGAVKPGEQGQGPVNTCFWGHPTANVGPINELNEPVNVAGPDTNVAYYYTRFQLPAGATVTLRGQFPHARFFSLTTYVTKESVTGYPSTSIYDEQINPDAGSINPFRPGEKRKAKNRSYTVTISGQTPPETPAPNMLYVGQEGKTAETQQVEMIMRLYRTDKNLEANGGVPLPSPTLNPQGGSPISEESVVCSSLEDISGTENVPTASEGVPPATYVHLRELAPAPHPALSTPLWERFFNNQRLVAPFYRGTPYEPLIAKLPTNITGGFYSTPANAYIATYADRTIGPNTEGENILVLHAKMPTHPATYKHDKINNSAGTQVRYWSLCAYGSIANPPLLNANSACLFDEEIPTNISDEYTIVVSLPQDRPKNAKPGCGVAWLNWGTAGDGQGRASLDVLVMRNQLPSPTFEQSIEKVTTPETEKEVMGDYYPKGTYMTKQEFEGRKCWSANAPAAAAKA